MIFDALDDMRSDLGKIYFEKDEAKKVINSQPRFQEGKSPGNKVD